VAIHATLLFFDDCPSWQQAQENLVAAARRLGADLHLHLEQVETLEDAERLGFTGSPTVLIDGSDPFAPAGAGPALACRIYATPTGLAGAPTVDQLVAVLARRLPARSGGP
jgi:hypothetical protein